MAIYARFERNGSEAYGLVESGRLRELRGGLFDPPELSEQDFDLATVQLLVPVQPPKIMGVGLNYRSHLSERKAPPHPEIFYKPVSALQRTEGSIELPSDSSDVHFEGELVVIVGKPLRKASRTQAEEAIFGVSCGNDVSDRNWQRGPAKDAQYWRAKGCDTFAPLGPFVVTGLNYSDLSLSTRLNGETVQQQRTSDLIFDVPTIVSFISHYVSLAPGDAIYTGTPGSTSAMKSGDIVEVEIEGIGILRNPVRG